MVVWMYLDIFCVPTILSVFSLENKTKNIIKRSFVEMMLSTNHCEQQTETSVHGFPSLALISILTLVKI